MASCESRKLSSQIVIGADAGAVDAAKIVAEQFPQRRRFVDGPIALACRDHYNNALSGVADSIARCNRI
jgi:hypothetical protein